MEIEYLRDCYGLEDCFITGLPQFSFFNFRSDSNRCFCSNPRENFITYCREVFPT